MKKFVLLLVCTFSLIGCSHSPYYNPKSGGEMSLAQHDYDSFFLLSDSGNQLHSVLISSQNLTSKGLVVHFHGNSGNISETIEKYLWVTEQSYDLLLFDYSGYGNSTGSPNFDNLYADAQTIFRFVDQQFSGLKDYQLISVGTSLGGAVMLDGLVDSDQKEMFDLVVVDSSFHSFSEVAQHVVNKSRFGFLGAWLIPLVIDKSHDPLPRLPQFDDTQLLFVHCQSDALIPWQFSEKMYQMSDVDKSFELLQGCEHARTFTPESTANRPLLLGYFNQLSAQSSQLEALSYIDN
ncbi:alpha/beta hydrolase [Agarivorans sp. TSD2052]|uniref:alpha/beta hydrolase n=1 Tax=Agarivorans sp. TSD2052 TaxID=2937286 RepID=UPI00200E761A|nr:alpha/beta hydrolase [Agarivorans sp. TSD2052]UPW19357.1 alpha/beta hydrolase [Agarivorans sp. TSD2052]